MARSRRGIRTVVLVLLALSLFQYLDTGAITWPGHVVRTVTGKLADFATRPEAGWVGSPGTELEFAL